MYSVLIHLGNFLIESDFGESPSFESVHLSLCTNSFFFPVLILWVLFWVILHPCIWFVAYTFMSLCKLILNPSTDSFHSFHQVIWIPGQNYFESLKAFIWFPAYIHLKPRTNLIWIPAWFIWFLALIHLNPFIKKYWISARIYLICCIDAHV